MISVKAYDGGVHIHKICGDFDTLCADIVCIVRSVHALMLEEDENMANEFRNVMGRIFVDADIWEIDCMEDDDEEE